MRIFSLEFLFSCFSQWNEEHFFAYPVLCPEVCAQKAEASFAREAERIRQTYAAATQKLNQQWKQTVAEAKTSRTELIRRLEAQARNLNATNEERRRRQRVLIEGQHAESMARFNDASARRLKQLENTYGQNAKKLEAARDTGIEAVEADWRNVVLPLYRTLLDTSAAATAVFPPWREEFWQQFTLPTESAQAARFAELAVDLDKLCDVVLQDQPLKLPGPAQISLPLLLAVPEQASVLIEFGYSPLSR